jgi:hypothetical protein
VGEWARRRPAQDEAQTGRLKVTLAWSSLSLPQFRRGHDQYRYLTPAQQRLPKIYLEHDPPRATATDTRHPVDDENVLLVHVTAFNRLMWDNGRAARRA